MNSLIMTPRAQCKIRRIPSKPFAIICHIEVFCIKCGGVQNCKEQIYNDLAFLRGEERKLSGLAQSFRKQRAETQLSTLMSSHNSPWRKVSFMKHWACKLNELCCVICAFKNWVTSYICVMPQAAPREISDIPGPKWFSVSAFQVLLLCRH